MSEHKYHFKTPEEIETAFYTAFVQANVEMMAELWSKQESLCVHPGSTVISGYDNVIRSWKHIFTDVVPPNVKLRVVQQIHEEDLAVHVVEEHISVPGEDHLSAIIIATNIYKRIDSDWFIVEHHGSMIQSEASGQTLQ